MSDRIGKSRDRAPQPKKKKGGARSLIELVVIVAIAVGLALLIQAFLVKPFRIPSPSMVPTLDPGQRVLVSRITYAFGSPERGQVVVFNPPAGAEESLCPVPHGRLQACPEAGPEKGDVNFIKRIVGLPGETWAMRNGTVYINGKALDERGYKTMPCTDPQRCNFPEPITIPSDGYFMMGDNRPDSDDSRFWGPVPRKWLIGNAFFTYWPPDRIGPM